MTSPKLTLNAGKSMPPNLVLKLIRRGVEHGCFPWPETPWTRYLRALQEKALSPTGRTLPTSEPELQQFPFENTARDAVKSLAEKLQKAEA